MNWSWQSGRKFVKIELNPYNASTGNFTQGIAKFDSTGNPTGTYNDTYNFHLGNTGCAVDTTSPNGYTCASDNTMTIRFASFDAATQNVGGGPVSPCLRTTNLQEEHGGSPRLHERHHRCRYALPSGPAMGSSFVQVPWNGSLVWVTQKDLEAPFSQRPRPCCGPSPSSKGLLS